MKKEPFQENLRISGLSFCIIKLKKKSLSCSIFSNQLIDLFEKNIISEHLISTSLKTYTFFLKEVNAF